MRLVKNQISINLVLLATACALVFFLKALGYRLDEAQTFVFPIVVFALFLVLRNISSLSYFILLVPLLFWLFGALHVRGFIVSPLSIPGVPLSKLVGDLDSLKLSAMSQRFNEIARTYGLTEAHVIRREFSTVDEASQWLSRKESSPFLVTGDTSWLKVVFKSDISNYFFQSKASKKLNEKFTLAIKNSFDAELFYSVPSNFTLSAEPQELTLHYLAWFAEGLKQTTHNERARAKKNSALMVAASYLGHWKSPTPLAIAHLFLGTAYSVESKQEKAAAECAKAAFKKAASYVSRNNDPEAYAAIFNNAAVNILLFAEGAEDINFAASLLWRAVGAKDKLGQPAPSALVALRNIESMYKSGLL